MFDQLCFAYHGIENRYVGGTYFVYALFESSSEWIGAVIYTFGFQRNFK